MSLFLPLPLLWTTLATFVLLPSLVPVSVSAAVSAEGVARRKSDEDKNKNNNRNSIQWTPCNDYDDLTDFDNDKDNKNKKTNQKKLRKTNQKHDSICERATVWVPTTYQQCEQVCGDFKKGEQNQNQHQKQHIPDCQEYFQGCSWDQNTNRWQGIVLSSTLQNNNHDKNNIQTIPIALIRIKATNHKDYRKALFVNPGGPGASGVDFVKLLHDNDDQDGATSWSLLRRCYPSWRKYDIVGFDPRGIARSCPGKKDGGCESILEYINTANVARDLFFINNLLADDDHRSDSDFDDNANDQDLPLLSYIGYSYGARLGQMYAALFPNHVGPMVLDGVDSVADKAGYPDCNPISFRHYMLAFESTLQEFCRQCDASTHCPRRRETVSCKEWYYALRDAIAENPTILSNGAVLNASLFEFVVYAGMYYQRSFLTSVQDAMVIEAFLKGDVDEETLVSVLDRIQSAFLVESLGGVATNCNDHCYSRDLTVGDLANDVQTLVEKGKTGQGDDFFLIDLLKTADADDCVVAQEWKLTSTGAFHGPFNVKTKTPVMIVNNEFDNATPLAGAQSATNSLPNSFLIVVRDIGHTVCFGNLFVNDVLNDYLNRPMRTMRDIRQEFGQTTRIVVESDVDNWFDFYGGQAVNSNRKRHLRETEMSPEEHNMLLGMSDYVRNATRGSGRWH